MIPITASMLYDYVTCPHRVSMDLFADQEWLEVVLKCSGDRLVALRKRGAANSIQARF